MYIHSSHQPEWLGAPCHECVVASMHAGIEDKLSMLSIIWSLGFTDDGSLSFGVCGAVQLTGQRTKGLHKAVRTGRNNAPS